MKRHPALIPFSRDHHHALVVAKQLRESSLQSAAEAVSAFQALWRHHERAHFQLEEETLEALNDHGQAASALFARMVDEHNRIRGLAQRLGVEVELPLARELGELLAAHVSFEERELFPAVERLFDRSQVRAVAAASKRVG